MDILEMDFENALFSIYILLITLLGSVITINSEENGASSVSEAAKGSGQASIKICT